tara:strand:+ start:486 stop:626 length:141 start_codon:yes stop_codon:yes gene_type:complete
MTVLTEEEFIEWSKEYPELASHIYLEEKDVNSCVDDSTNILNLIIR